MGCRSGHVWHLAWSPRRCQISVPDSQRLVHACGTLSSCKSGPRGAKGDHRRRLNLVAACPSEDPARSANHLPPLTRAADLRVAARGQTSDTTLNAELAERAEKHGSAPSAGSALIVVTSNRGAASGRDDQSRQAERNRA